MRSPLRGSGQLFQHATQGSQSLALGLTLTAASQLVGEFVLTQPKARKSLALGLTLAAASQLVGESQNRIRPDPSSRADH